MGNPPLSWMQGSVLKMNKKLVVIALVTVLACVGLVAAEETGLITINILNSPNG
jgi:hypothetical protein